MSREGDVRASSEGAVVRLKEISPTVFFIGAHDALRQGVDVTLTNAGAAVPVTITVAAVGARWEVSGDPVLLPTGRQTHRITIPDVREPVDLTFSLLSSGQVCHRRTVRWRPERHWHVYLVPQSHHDLGYSDLPSNVLREQARFLDDVLRFCEMTDDWPEESRFRYVVEQGWSVQYYVAHRPPEAVRRLAGLVREGRVELTALLANEITELCGHEEQIRLLYPSFRLGRLFGAPVRTAELNDIPGVSWGLASVLAGSGVRYLVAGLPGYFSWGFRVHSFWDEDAVLPHGSPGAFWWEGPDGGRVLFWCGGGFSPWSIDQAVCELPSRLVSLEECDYPSDHVRYVFQGGLYDNAPPHMRVSQIARQWNDQWAFPRMLVATNARFFEAFEQTAGSRLRVLRGDLPNTDYTVGATSMAKETGINRRTQATLPPAESWAACATLVDGHDCPVDTVAEAFNCMLLYDEHTFGLEDPVGPAQDAATSQKGQFAYRAAALAEDVLSKGINRLADHVALQDEGYHLVVFNGLARERSDVVRMPLLASRPCGRPMQWRSAGDAERVWIRGTALGRDLVDLPLSLLDEPFELIDLSTGRRVPYQVVTLDGPHAPRQFSEHRFGLGGGSTAPGGRAPALSPDGQVLGGNPAHLKEIIFVAEDLPPLGFKTYRVAPCRRAPIFDTSLRTGEDWIENRFYRVRFHRESGTVASIFDKELQREWIDQDAPYRLNQLVVRSPVTGTMSVASALETRWGQNGPVRVSIVSTCHSAGCPQVVQEIALYDRLKRIDVENRVLRDASPLLECYFAFPFALERPQFCYEATNATIEPIRDQLPGSNTDAYAVQNWVNVRDRGGSITWTSVDAPVVALGGLWPGYVSQAHHCVPPPGYGHSFLRDPAELRHGHIYSYAMVNNFRTNFAPVQVGDALFHYAVTSSGAEWRVDQPRDFGWARRTPLHAVRIAGPQDGSLDVAVSFCHLEPSNVTLLALKPADDGDGIIIRLEESEGRSVTATVTLPFVEVVQASATDLVERDCEDVWCDRHAVRVPLQARGIATVRCRSGRQWPAVKAFALW